MCGVVLAGTGSGCGAGGGGCSKPRLFYDTRSHPPCLAQGLLAAAAAAAMAVAVVAMALLRPAARPTYLVDWYSFRPPDRRGRHNYNMHLSLREPQLCHAYNLAKHGAQIACLQPWL